MINKVLVIKSSPIPDAHSVSTHLLNKFLEYYKVKNASATFEELDLNTLPMASKTMTRENLETFFNAEDSDKFIEQLKSVSKVIIAAPMTNFGFPAVLKNYIDHISVANKTFSYKYSKKGEAKGLLDHLKVQILTTQGAPYGWYQWGNHTENLRGIWDFLGATVAEPLLLASTKVAYLNKKPEEAIADFDARIKIAAEEF
ncbi:FMN-dependent NADH-azoreductase [[Mycoplasma] testudinis]|uniref:FMN-dependent NADH-azoreductase n=1 Tax=[Mycoplasma] testudinis TaxID=33924 RepID=UPI00055FD50F|nr:FMN-dependent NADH-azoreductase [[Mycoplasma] testudinis]